MFNSMFDELKEVKYFILGSRNIKYLKEIKSRGVFRTQASVYEAAFLWIYLTAYYFCNKSSIIDVRLGYT